MSVVAYSQLVAVEKEKLPRDAYEKLLVACNDDGTIILKLTHQEPFGAAFDGH